MEFILVYMNFPDEEIARQIGTALIRKQHAACVNIIPRVQSIYQWQGELKSAVEVMMIAKTTTQQYRQLESEVAESHPYDVPEIIAVPMIDGAPSYLDWIQGQLPNT